MDNNNEERNNVMVSNLPLLFSDGKPTSVASMSVEDLQYFIHFLMKCILQCEPSGWVKHPKFKWWPADVPWSPIILTKKHQTPIWKTKLQRVVRCCYDYNGCGYLLQFSAKLHQMIGTFKFKDNWDGTTSMFDSNSGKLLVTFRNENMNYDTGLRQQNNQRIMLLPRLNSPGSPSKMGSPTSHPSLALEGPSSPQMVEPPVCDVYLCDYCGADFSELESIKAHEVRCMAEKALEVSSNNNLVELDTTDMNQAKFMWYLSMSGGDQSEPFGGMTPKKPSVKKLCTLSDKRFTIIPFSSDLAQTFKKVILTQPAAENLFNKYERLCPAKPKVSDFNSFNGIETLNHQLPQSMNLRNRYPGVIKKEEWTHLYCFNKADRKERMITIATGLTKRARGLVRFCRKASVRLERLKAEEIEEWTRPKPKPRPPPMLQPWVQKSIAHLSPECTISIAPVDSLSVWMRPSSQQRVTPSLTISRPEVTKHLGFARSKQHPSIVKPKPRAPPGLVPLITNSWSLHPVQSVRPKVTNQFTLPDLIPVQQTPRPIARPSNPVVIQMPTSVRSVPSVNHPRRSSCKDVIDLCSSDEEDMNPKHNAIIGAALSKPIVLPPGISITHIKKDPSVNRCPASSHPSTPRPAAAKFQQASHPPAPRPGAAKFQQASHPSTPRPVAVNFQQMNNSPLKFSTMIGSTSVTKISPPTLTFKGQQNNLAHPNTIPIARTVPPILAMDPSSPIVTPLKLGKLPMEKREQMKQSLLKIQQQEGKTPPSSSEKTTPSPTNAMRIEKVEGAVPKTSPLSSLPIVSNKDVSKIVVNACKEPKQKGLTTLHYSEQRSALRKRSQDSDHFGQEDDDFESELSITPSRKIPKLDRRLFPQREFEGQREDDGNNSFSTIIEVDVGGRDGSRASSLGSLTPDSRSKQKKTELSRLLEDECKELRRKGLEELPCSDQRITRCRTRSLPLAALYKS